MHSINGHEDGRQVKLYDEAVGGDVPGRLEYYHKDHLGNIRLTFSDIDQDGAITVGSIYDPNNEIVLEKHYYPFGMDMTGAWFATVAPDNAYGYNNKELDEAMGLYDYGARYYDPAVARWGQVDPLAEGMSSPWSPYNYVLNNPIRLIDPDGMIWKDPNQANSLKERISDKITSLNSSIDALTQQLTNDGDLSEEQMLKMTTQIADLDSRIGELYTTLSDIDALRDDQHHTYDLVDTDAADAQHHVKMQDGIVSIRGSNDAIHIHEIRHASLSLSSEEGLQFNREGYLLPTLNKGSGYGDEKSGYRAQYSYDPLSLPRTARSIDDINLDYIGGITDDKGRAYYPAIKKRLDVRNRNIRKAKKRNRG